MPWRFVSHLVYRILLQTDTPMELRSPITKMLMSEHLDWHRNRWGPTSGEVRDRGPLSLIEGHA
jgi:hypothetical protein